ncbi:MAG: 50S ribosomal protein L37ae [Desulfurococcales archaeon]|nr:50S ribosomal protein L37ae [Desulfurococcales archaeon]MEB3789789.1 50S ribosomal protein L37ae [Desulfurococcales archaeon]
MARRTKIVGPVGRYGPRYGVRVRKRVRDILLKKQGPHTCPFCGAQGTVYRVSVGIWSCRKCGNTWAGAAYTPRSDLAAYFKKYVVKNY